MPVQLNCPHCKKRMVVRDDAAGTSITCPKCKGAVDVPKDARTIKAEDLMARPDRPEDKKKPDTLVEQAARRTCEHCGADLPLTGHVCLKCFRDTETGKKLGAWKRFGQKSVAYRLTVTVGSLLAAFVVFAAVILLIGNPENLNGGNTKPPTKPPDEADSAEQLIQKLILAENVADRAFALRMLATHADAVKAIKKLCEGGIKAQHPEKGEIAATEGDVEECVLLLAHIDDPDADKLLADLYASGANPRLQVIAAAAMAQKGNETGLVKMMDEYFANVRKLALESYIDARKLVDDREPLQAVIDQRQKQLAVYRKAILTLQHRGLAVMLERYWVAWDWLGSNRGEAWMREVDNIESLAADPDFVIEGSSSPVLEGDDETEDPIYGVVDPATRDLIQGWLDQVEVVKDEEGTDRKALGWLKTVLKRGRPNQQMAAALYVARRTAPKQEDRERYVRIVGKLLDHPEKMIRQRAIWTMCQLIGRRFANYDAHMSPAEADDEAIEDAKKAYELLFDEAPVWRKPETDPEEAKEGDQVGGKDESDTEAK